MFSGPIITRLGDRGTAPTSSYLQNIRNTSSWKLYMIRWIKFYQGLLKVFLFVLINPGNIFINTRGDSLDADVPDVKTTTYGSHYMQFVHGISSKKRQIQYHITTLLPDLTATS